MKVLAAVCGVMIVLLGFWSTGRTPTELQSLVQIVCLIGGLILCILSVVLARLDGLAKRLDAFAAAPDADWEELPDDAAADPVPGSGHALTPPR